MVIEKDCETDAKFESITFVNNTTSLDETSMATFEHIYYDPVKDKIVTDRALETTLNSLFLGEHHKMSSGGENIFFTNLSSNINWYPSWGGLRDHSVLANQSSSGVISPSARVYKSYVPRPLGGNPVPGTSISYSGTNFFGGNIQGVGVKTVIAEPISADIVLRYELSVNNVRTYVQYNNTHNGFSVGDELEWWFDHPIDIGAGSTNTVNINKINSEGVDTGYLKVYEGDVPAVPVGSPAGTAAIPRYQTSVMSRLFVDKSICFESDLEILDLEGFYNIYVNPLYTGNDSNGTLLKPYISISDAVTNSTLTNNKIFIQGDNIITSEIILPRSLSFFGLDGTKIRYQTFDVSNENIFKFIGTDNTLEFLFKNIEFSNAGDYALNITNSTRLDVIDCSFYTNGWNGTNLNTVVSSTISNVYGYDSTNVNLDNFFNSADISSNSGAVLLENINTLQIVGNKFIKNNGSIRIIDCGIGSTVFITRNVSSQNVGVGISLESGTLLGCQNITTLMNYSSFNANNGLSVVGGINNKFSQNEVNGNWNAGFYASGAVNTTLRDSGLYDNNRSLFTGIGTDSNSKATIHLNEESDLIKNQLQTNTLSKFIVEILDTQIHNTGLGSNTSKIGIYISVNIGSLPDSDKNIIKIDDVGFIGQYYAVDLTEVNITNIRLSLGDNSYQNIGLYAVTTPLGGMYSELPFSNHIMEVPQLDVYVDTIKNIISLKEGIGGNVINNYAVNELQSIDHTTHINIIQKGSNKIQLRGLELGQISINGVSAGETLSFINNSLNAVFNMDLTKYKEFFISEVGLNPGNILPAQTDNWYISYGIRINEKVLVGEMVTDLEDKQPFYNGNLLEKGHQYTWTHDTVGEYIIGLWVGAETPVNITESKKISNWDVAFSFKHKNPISLNNHVAGTGPITTDIGGSVAIDLNSRYSEGYYNINNSTKLSLRYGNDNYLYLFDVTNNKNTIIAASNTALTGDNQTIYFAGTNTPSARFPVMQESTDIWSFVHDLDSSENNEWSDGIEEDSILKSNMEINPGEKINIDLSYFGRDEIFGLGYTGASTNVNNAPDTITDSFKYETTETILVDPVFWNINVNSVNYQVDNRWKKLNVVSTVGIISLRYYSDNTLVLFSEDNDDIIATKNINLDGDPFNLYFGVNEAHPFERIPSIQKFSLNEEENDSNRITWYYIESPDGVFHYPLFKTQEEANTIDRVEGGTGQNTTITYVDDIINGTIWYKPVTNFVNNGITNPSDGVFGNSTNVLWNEQATNDDSNYAPTFTNITYPIQEGNPINILYKTSGDTNTYTITNIPLGYTNTGTNITRSKAEDITNGYGLIITHVLNVSKFNNYGSVQGTITINILPDLLGNEFQIIEKEDSGVINNIKFTQDGGNTELEFSSVIFYAGETYTFYIDDSSIEATDAIEIVLNSDGSTYLPGVSYSTETISTVGSFMQFILPEDVPPVSIKWTSGSSEVITIPLTINGSSLVENISGIILEGPSVNQTGNNLFDDGLRYGWMGFNETLSAGQRLILPGEFLKDLALAMSDNSNVLIGLKDDAWGNFKIGATGLKEEVRIVLTRNSSTNIVITIGAGVTLTNISTSENGLETIDAFIEIPSTGNNIKIGFTEPGVTGSSDVITTPYSDWTTGHKGDIGSQSYVISSIDILVFGLGTTTALNTDDVDWMVLTKIFAPVNILSPWSKAIDFTSTNHNLSKIQTTSVSSPISQDLNTTVVEPVTSGNTTNDNNGRPWATSVVFNVDGDTASQYIWNQGDGVGNANIYLKYINNSGSGNLFFGWSDSSSTPNEIYIGLASTNIWTGVYIGYNGTRLSSSDATAANLAACFDIRLMDSNNHWTLGPNISTTSQWGLGSSTIGIGMDNIVSGLFTVGKPFDGQVASMVVTTLRINFLMPTNAEILQLIKDPVRWVTESKIGYLYRPPDVNYNNADFQLAWAPARATQVWLMGDGSQDGFTNGIRNYIYTLDSINTKLNINNMLASNIIDVTIPNL